jgi:hypothetical protein
MTRLTIGVVLALVAAITVAPTPTPDGKRWWSFVEMLANDDMQWWPT